MTTAQESSNGHRVLPPPFSVENPAELNRPDLPADKPDINSDTLNSRISDLRSPGAAPPFAANAYHVPPKRYAPKPGFHQQEFSSCEIDTTPSLERCQFMFSDGRQCTMARYDIHPSLCCFHAQREDQLFGSPGGKVFGATLDLPELYSASCDLTTAAGVNLALGQVFRLLAQRRISRQEAATFCHLAQVLLRSISLARAEFDAAVAGPASADNPEGGRPVVECPKGLSSRESPPPRTSWPSGASRRSQSHQEFSRVNKVYDAEGPLRDQCASEESLPRSTSSPFDANSAPAIAPSASSEPPAVSVAPEIPLDAGFVTNSRTISTYKNIKHKPTQNEHLRKTEEGPLPHTKIRARSTAIQDARIVRQDPRVPCVVGYAWSMRRWWMA